MSDEQKSVTVANETNGNGQRAASAVAPAAHDIERSARPATPYTMMRRMAEDMDRLFEEWQFGRGWLTPIFGRDPLAKRIEEFGSDMFLPDIEAFESDGRFIVRADLPGIRKEDVSIEVTDSAVTIHGERRQEEKEVRKGFYRSERNFGSFSRTVPLPADADIDAVRATMNDGVLEIAMPIAEVNGKRVEID
jgi:HSP20 family protein